MSDRAIPVSINGKSAYRVGPDGAVWRATINDKSPGGWVQVTKPLAAATVSVHPAVAGSAPAPCDLCGENLHDHSDTITELWFPATQRALPLHTDCFRKLWTLAEQHADTPATVAVPAASAPKAKA